MESKGKIMLALLLISLTSCRSQTITDGPSNLSLMPTEIDDSGSIEMPVRKPRMESAQNRPIIEFVLGVLDTFHSSTKSELRRIQARHARQALFEISTTTTTTTTTAAPVSKLNPPKLTTPRKRFSIGKL